jgi:hypothetical protein
MTRLIDLTVRFDLDEPVSRARYKAVLAAYAERADVPEPQKEQNGPQRGPDTPTEAVEKAQQVFGNEMAEWPPGVCPIHGSASWRESNFGGFYCTAQAAQGEPADKKGRCKLKSGFVYEGRKIP